MLEDNFRTYVHFMYMEHKKECDWYRIPCKYAGLGQYFRKNKYFLKRKYKEENGH